MALHHHPAQPSADALHQFVQSHSNAFVFTHCDTNALRIWRQFGGEIFRGTADRFEVCDGQIATQPIRVADPHFWNVFEMDGQEVLFDAYNAKPDKAYHYANHQGTEDKPERLMRERLNYAKTQPKAFKCIAPLVHDEVISAETLPGFDRDRFFEECKTDTEKLFDTFQRPVAIAHITCPACLAAIITTGRFQPAYDSDRAADGGLNGFIVEHGYLPQAFSGTGAELLCDWYGEVKEDAKHIQPPYEKDVLWFDPTWRAFIPRLSRPELLRVTGYRMTPEAERDWYLANHNRLARWFLRVSTAHLRSWLRHQRQSLNARIQAGINVTVG